MTSQRSKKRNKASRDLLGILLLQYLPRMQLISHLIKLKRLNIQCMLFYFLNGSFRFTFLPAALFIQFLNLTNVFYLANVILQFQPGISTNSPLASLIPLSFVIFVGMLKEFLADLKRWSADKKTNQILYKILSSKDDIVNGFHSVRSDQIKVGDIL
jgi:Phospholipid-translocating ATPase N-terminal